MTAFKKFHFPTTAGIVLIMALTACQNTSPQAVATSTDLPVSTATAALPPTPTATEAPTDMPTETPIPTATLPPAASPTPEGAYTNTTLGFSLTLPAGWAVQTSDDNQVTFVDPTGAATLTVYELTTGEKLPMREAVRRMAASITGAAITFGDPFPMKVGQDVTLQEIDCSLKSGENVTMMRLLMGELNGRTYIIYSLIPREIVADYDPFVGEVLKSLVFLSP